MALFKPLLGKRENLPKTLTSGYAYFCTDDGSFWIDYKDSDGIIKRKQINAQEAEKIIGYDIVTTLSNNNATIPVSSAVFSAIESAKNDLNTDLSGRIDDIENDIKTTNETLSDVSQELENYKKTNDNAVSTNATEIANNKSAIEGIKGDYLTSTDKEQLEDTIDTRVGGIENNFSEYKTEVEERFTEVDTIINNHVSDINNPHGVTKEQIGLGNVENTSDLEKPVSYAMQEALDEKASSEHEHNVLYYTKDEIEALITVEDIDNICGTQLITFTLGMMSYQAEEGMTWVEWVDSSYNNPNFYIADSRVVTSGGGKLLGVIATDKIIANHVYEVDPGNF